MSQLFWDKDNVIDLIVPLSHNSCYISIHILCTKCPNYYGTKINIIDLIVTLSHNSCYTSIHILYTKCLNYYGTKIII